MAAITGKDLYVAFKGVDISGDYRKFDPKETGDKHDQSAGADAAKTYLTGLTDGTATYAAVMQADGSEMWTAVAINGEGTLEWADEGTAAGKQKHWVNAICLGRGRTVPYNGVVEITADFQFSGEVTDTVYPA